MMRFDNVTPRDITQAARLRTLDQAVRLLQETADVREGDVAGQFFSDEVSPEHTWTYLTPSQRRGWLEKYVEAERLFEAV